MSGSETWGGITLLREAGRPPFEPRDASLLASLGPDLVEGLVRAILLTDPPTEVDETDDTVPGVVLLAPDGSIEMADAGARRWLAELTNGSRPDDEPPTLIAAVAHRARTAATGRSTGPAATARIRTASGRWLLAHGSVIGDGSDSRAAVILEPAHAHHLAPMIAGAYDLTSRERAVTELVARGLSTSEIAEQLHLSAYTVQDHLKSIFDKVGVRTRGELVARVFFDHYAPRLASGDPGNLSADGEEAPEQR